MGWSRQLALGLAAAAGLAAAPAVHAWPERPVTIVVPYTPGGTVDVLARKLGVELTKAWGQPIVIDNKPGHGGSLGTSAVARAKPDGYTVLLTTNAPLTINPHIYKAVGYNAETDFAPVAIMGTSSMVLVANLKLPVKSLKDLIALAKSKPGGLSAGSSGNGTTTHLALVELNRRAGIDIVHVPYRGGVPSLTGTIAGEVQISFSDITPAAPLIKDGKLAGLVTAAPKRTPLAPNLPTMAEEGLDKFDATAWVAMMAPARTPSEVAEKLNKEINRLLADATFKAETASVGLELRSSSVAEFAAFMKAEIPRWQGIVSNAGIKPE